MGVRFQLLVPHTESNDSDSRITWSGVARNERSLRTPPFAPHSFACRENQLRQEWKETDIRTDITFSSFIINPIKTHFFTCLCFRL